jgi:uncharacterized membrane protein
MEGLPIEERREILQAEIRKYVKRGFRVISQTDTTAQLLKPKKLSLFWAIFWFLMLFIPFVIYLLIYMARKDEQVWLEVDPDGKVNRR